MRVRDKLNEKIGGKHANVTADMDVSGLLANSLVRYNLNYKIDNLGKKRQTHGHSNRRQVTDLLLQLEDPGFLFTKLAWQTSLVSGTNSCIVLHP